MRVLWFLIAFAASAAGQEIIYNDFIAHDYFRIKIKINSLKGDTTLYIPTPEHRSKKISESDAAFFIRSRWVSSSGFEYIFPSSVRVTTPVGRLKQDLFFTIRKEQTPAEIDLLFRIPAVSHEKKMFVMGELINIPVLPKLPGEERNADRLFELAEKAATEENYAGALSLYIKIILTDKSRYEETLVKAASMQTELGAEYLSKGNIDDAYILLSSAAEVRSKHQEPWMSRADSLFARCLVTMGEKSYNNQQPGAALYFLGESMKFLQSPEVEQRYYNIQGSKRSLWTLGFTGLLPGGGQFYKGEYAKGAIMAGIFAAGISIMSINFDEADKSTRWADYYGSQIAGS
ncbi:MAG: hypothetical protein IT279_09780, partial [Ignavibacteriaceae bacterium]|nr:hypothetical protein [Ignavibacteriaceae bacterium]